MAAKPATKRKLIGLSGKHFKKISSLEMFLFRISLFE